MRVGRKVRGHPVEDHADAALVQVVDEVHEVLRRAVARGRREVAGGLVAPGAVERVLGDRHQLHVREAGLDRRGRPASAPARASSSMRPSRTAPRPDVHLVDRHRRVERVLRAARRHPFGVAPLVLERPDHASRWPAAARRARRTGRPCRPRAGRRATRCGTCRPGLAARPGTSACQMPEPSPRERIGCAAAFQPFKSPMTETSLALGAHTANSAPPSRSRQPSFSYIRVWEPSRNR